MCESQSKLINFAYSVRILLEEKIKPVQKEYDLKKSELCFLLILDFYPELNSAKKISELGELKRGNISFIVETLFKRGFIVQETDENDRRSNKIMLTEKARSIIEESKAILDKTYLSIMDGISKEEIESGERLFEKMYSNIKNQKK
ncbi:MAG: hypothetical protein MR408_02000 [Spirochaetia bacterium]|nr:hypothetical protein [Spirochaetia bacterium]